MKYKFSFDQSRWLEFFSWKHIPEEAYTLPVKATPTPHGLISEQEKKKDRLREEERKHMSSEIDTLLNRGKYQKTE
jgi:hypothetical protein